VFASATGPFPRSQGVQITPPPYATSEDVRYRSTPINQVQYEQQPQFEPMPHSQPQPLPMYEQVRHALPAFHRVALLTEMGVQEVLARGKAARPATWKGVGKAKAAANLRSATPGVSGCPVGSQNWSAQDIMEVAKLALTHLPIGQDGWIKLAPLYNKEYAVVNDWQEHDWESICNKFS
jgi:hypothetical protein